MTALSSAPGHHRLRLGDPDGVRVVVSRSPALSMTRWIVDEASAARARLGGGRTQLGDLGMQPALAALGLPGLDRLPDCITSTDPDTSGIREHIERLWDSSGEELPDEVSRLWGPAPPTPWRYAAEHPRVWMQSLALVTTKLWARYRRRWQLGQRLLDKEIARIGVAAVTGTMDALLDSLHPRLHSRDGNLDFDSHCDTEIELAGRQLILAPTLVRAHQVTVGFDRPDAAYVAYPAPGYRADAGPGGEFGPPGDSLALVLGPLRAAALKTLARPQAMRDLATSLHCAPSTATYHCDQLEQAGLITRERNRQTIWVARTERGDEIVALLDG